MAGQDWQRLADEVRKRRAEQRRPLDLAPFGGPSEMTVRKIESGDAVSIRPQTRTRLEAALGWRDGTVDRILDGTVTDEDLTALALRAKNAPPIMSFGGGGGAEMHVGHPRESSVTFVFIGSSPARMDLPGLDHVSPGDSVTVPGRITSDQGATWDMEHPDGGVTKWAKHRWRLITQTVVTGGTAVAGVTAHAGVARGRGRVVDLEGAAASASSASGELDVVRGALQANLPMFQAELTGTVGAPGDGEDHLRALVDDVSTVDHSVGEVVHGGSLVSVRYSVESAIVAVRVMEPQSQRMRQVAQALELARQLLSEEMHRQPPKDH